MKNSQCTRILQYMENHGSITASQAMDDLGCFRLAARIADLRKRGYAIESQIVEGKNRHEETTHYAVYRLINQEVQNA